MEAPCATVERLHDGQPRVRLQGDVDFRNAQTVREAVRSAAREAGDPIVVDLGRLTFIDSSGISALVRVALQERERGRGLMLEGARPYLLRLLSEAGFARYFLIPGGLPMPAPLSDCRVANAVWQHLSFTIPARTHLVKHVRVRVAEMLQSLQPDSQLLDAVNLAVGEAASNAVRHGCREDDCLKVRVKSATDGHTLVVEINDPGPGFDPDQVSSPEVGELREGGMGIYFMRLTMDGVEYTFDNGTTVRLLKHLHAHQPAPV
jgi:serine/threonine-protein kinase RsbW